MMTVTPALLQRWFPLKSPTDCFMPDVHVINKEHARQLIHLLQQHFKLAEKQ